MSGCLQKSHPTEKGFSGNSNLPLLRGSVLQDTGIMFTWREQDQTHITMTDKVVTKLYGFGSNGEGQLGVGHKDDLDKPQICRFAPSTTAGTHLDDTIVHTLPVGETVKKVVAGGNHTILLTSEGHVYTTGNSVDGRCGHLGLQDTFAVFTPVNGTTGGVITDIAATWEASFIVEDTHKVWACGSGLKGELGLGEHETRLSTPGLVFNVEDFDAINERIVSVSGSMSHVVLVLSNGDTYGWGSARKGQLGHALQPRKIVWKPQRLDLSFRPSEVVTGRDFSILRNYTGDSAMLGDIKVAGDSIQHSMRHAPSLLLAAWSTAYLLHSGHIDGYGQGRRGQLPPTSLPNVVAVAAGSEHCVALLGDGKVVAWGWGEHGNCGSPLDDRGNVMDRFNIIPVPLEDGENIAGVGAGCASSFVWTTRNG